MLFQIANQKADVFISYEPKGMIIDKNSFKVEEIFNFGLQGRFSRERAFVFFDDLHSFKHFD